MKAEILKQGINYSTSKKNYTKSKMYEFDFSTDIMVEENQDDGTTDGYRMRKIIEHAKISLRQKAVEYYGWSYIRSMFA